MMIQKNVKVADDVTEKVTDVTSNVTENVTEKFVKSDEYNISDMDYKVLEQLMLNPSKTTSLYAENLNVTRQTISRSLKALKDQGIITRIGSDRKGYWRIERGVKK